MRKFTFFIASLLVAIGAMAQTTTIDVAKTYTLECQSGVVHNTTRFIGVTDGVINGQSATGAEITFEAVEEGSYYIKVGDKYINHNGTAISASAEASTAWVLGTVNNLVTFKVPETTLYLNNNGSDCTDGTVTNLKANDHSTNANQAPTANNACSTWAMVEYVAPEEGGEEEATTISSLADFNPNKYYTVSTNGRGGWAVNNEGTQFRSTNDAGFGTNVDAANTQHQFAILSADGTDYYLYSIHAQKFIKADRTMVAGIADAIAITDASSYNGENRFRVNFRDIADSYINIGGSNQMTIDWWSTIDQGNAVLFTEAGDFDPTEALAMLSSAVTVTYTFVHESETIATQTATVNKGEAYPAINATLPYGVTATVPEGFVEGSTEKTIEVEVSKELPFVAASDAASISNWYYVRMHTNEPGFIGDIAEDNTINVGSFYVATSAESKDNYLWGFVGNVFDGIKVVNKGTGKMLTSTGDGNVTLTDEGTALFIDETEAPGNMNATDGFCLRNPEAANFINANYTVGKLSHWSARDNGSTFMVIEPTESLDVTITEAGYATYFWGLPAYIPEGVQAYIVSDMIGSYAIMSEITGTIPANTGVILKGNAGAYSFAVAHYATAANGNKLKGTNATTDITPAENTTYYVLANGENGVGLYKDELDGDTFRNNANKAYLPVVVESGNAAPSYSFNFDWAGTTAIEGVVAEGAQDGAIYDITGRRVKAITAPGIYIVNGKKVVK